MFKIIILIILAGSHGFAQSEDRFSTLAECEAARPDMVEGMRRAIEARHGPAKLQARCVPVEFDPAAPEYPA